jgi:hypothetical protein
MSPSVAAVLYFACGFPVAMYLVIRRRPTWAKLALWSLFWPFFAALLVFRLLKPTDEMRENARRLRIERVAAAIEREAFDSGTMTEVFEFREIFYRYAGLAQALSSPIRDVADLHERCLIRNNRNKLAFHTSAARAEFIDAVQSLAASGGNGAVRCAAELARIVDDLEAASDLEERLSRSSAPTPLRRVDTSPVS